MNNQEIQQALVYLDEGWPGRPLTDTAKQLIGSRLAPYPARAVMAALERLLGELEWRPSWARLRRELEPAPAAPDLSAEFERVFMVMRLHPPGHRDDKLDPRTREVVRRMGGWRAIGQWQLEERHWREKDFARVYADVHDSIEAGQLELAQPKAEAAKAIEGAVVEESKPEPREYTEREKEVMGAVMAKLTQNHEPVPRKPESMLDRMVKSELKLANKEGRKPRSRDELAKLIGRSA